MSLAFLINGLMSAMAVASLFLATVSFMPKLPGMLVPTWSSQFLFHDYRRHYEQADYGLCCIGLVCYRHGRDTKHVLHLELLPLHALRHFRILPFRYIRKEPPPDDPHARIYSTHHDDFCGHPVLLGFYRHRSVCILAAPEK